MHYYQKIIAHVRGLRRMNRLLLGISVIALLVVATQIGLNLAEAAAQPSLQVDAPSFVDVGEPIRITLTAKHVRNMAGYEANLLYDTSAIQFGELRQRNNDLKKIRRDVSPLGAVEMPNGVALGLYTCPGSNCLTNSRSSAHSNGNVTLAQLTLDTKKAGLVEIRIDGLEFVDEDGNALAVDPVQPITVQVGPLGAGPTYRAPSGPGGKPKPSTTAAGPFDLTGDKRVTNADAMEAALEWMQARESGNVCGTLTDPKRDVNHDGCIDVADLQLIAAHYSTAAGTKSGAAAGTESNADAAASATSASDVDVIGQVGSNANNVGRVATIAADGSASTFVVNSTDDRADANPGDGICATSGAVPVCTLRAAITEANLHPGPDTIAFNIPGTGVQSIVLGSSLPTLNDTSGPTTIDGYTQPGASPNTDPLVDNAVIKIEVVGNDAQTIGGISITSAGNVIRGLAIYKLKRQITIYGNGAANNVIVGNFIGTNAAGTFASPSYISGNQGVSPQQGAAGTRIGDTAPADRNLISGNAQHGIATYNEGTDNTVIYNNLIGLSPGADRRLSNQSHGIDINTGTSFSIIGGTGQGQRNVVSGNGYEGIEISHGLSTRENKIVGNYVGTDVTGNQATSYSYNVHYGINIEDGIQNTTISDNVVGNNQAGGINLTASYTQGTHVFNNRVGISLNGTPIPNGNVGVQLDTLSSTGNVIGPGNIIAYNNGAGIRVTQDDSRFNTFTQNSIYANTSLGIDLKPLGKVNPNDPGDADAGANDLLNFPVLTSATQYAVAGTACANCIIEVFVADQASSPWGPYGQGQTFVGSATSDGSGAFTVNVTGVSVGSYVTATATDSTGNTSEFSMNFVVSNGPPPPPPTGPTPTATPASSPTPITYASDTYTRQATAGWGNADIGGAWGLYGGTSSDYNVNGTKGTIAIPAGASRTAALLDVGVQDADLSFRVATDKAVSGGSQYASVSARRRNSSTEYRMRIQFTRSDVQIQASKLTSGTETFLGSSYSVPGLVQSPGTYFWVRAKITGTNPTTISMKAWQDGQPEPTGWQYTISDAEVTLQTSGAVGLRGLLSSSSTDPTVVFSFDDFRVVASSP